VRYTELAPDSGHLDRGARLAGTTVMARGDDYVDFNQYEDALASLELVALVAPLVRDKPQYWKWVIVGAHNSLQGAMVCAYADSTGTSVLENKSAKKMLEWLYADQTTRGPYPEERLAPFGELLGRCVAGSSLFEPLVLTPEQHKDIKRLHEHFRNDFAHFTPKGWSIERAGLPRIIRAALDAAEELMHRYYVIGHMDDNQQKRLTDALATARKNLPLRRRPRSRR